VTECLEAVVGGQLVDELSLEGLHAGHLEGLLGQLGDFHFFNLEGGKEG